jgi:hypothetical protein
MCSQLGSCVPLCVLSSASRVAGRCPPRSAPLGVLRRKPPRGKAWSPCFSSHFKKPPNRGLHVQVQEAVASTNHNSTPCIFLVSASLSGTKARVADSVTKWTDFSLFCAYLLIRATPSGARDRSSCHLHAMGYVLCPELYTVIVCQHALCVAMTNRIGGCPQQDQQVLLHNQGSFLTATHVRWERTQRRGRVARDTVDELRAQLLTGGERQLGLTSTFSDRVRMQPDY